MNLKEKIPAQNPQIADSIIDLIGNTPMVRLNKVNEGAQIICKLESLEPCGSVKDRVAKAMIEEAEKSGKIKPGDLIVEPTSGNTGIGLAMVASVKGYKLCIVMPENMSMERRIMIRALGAELILTSSNASDPQLIAKAAEIAKEKGGHMLNQFSNPQNPKVHRDTTGPEIWEQTQGKIDIFVSGCGTGGTLTGVSQFLKSKNPNIICVAVEPYESPILSGGMKGPHNIPGIGPDFIPEIMDVSIIDEIQDIKSQDALNMARKLAIQEGIMVGPSSGAAIQAAINIGRKPENKNKMIVVIAPSFGERYLSTELF